MSEALLLLLTKLAKHSEKGTTGRRDKADTALRQNMRQLIDDWDGAAALPEESYWQTLEQLIAEPATDAPETSLRVVAHQRVSLLRIRDGEEVPCETLDRCLVVSRYLLERAGDWLGEGV